MKARCSHEVIIDRVKETIELKKKYLTILNSGKRYHIKCQNGNSKTGKNCMTVSLISGHDCQNCKHCIWDCYDINNVMFMPKVKNDRARNSALHTFNPDWYWEDVEMDIRYNCTQELRVNVGGDSTYYDIVKMAEIAERNPKCDILFFTKNYDVLNKFLEERGGINWRDVVPTNLKPMWSRWCGLENNNKYNVPEAHILWEDGTTTAPEFGATYCGGNCSECHFNDKGCWNLKNGDSVIFNAH